MERPMDDKPLDVRTTRRIITGRPCDERLPKIIVVCRSARGCANRFVPRTTWCCCAVGPRPRFGTPHRGRFRTYGLLQLLALLRCRRPAPSASALRALQGYHHPVRFVLPCRLGLGALAGTGGASLPRWLPFGPRRYPGFHLRLVHHTLDCVDPRTKHAKSLISVRRLRAMNTKARIASVSAAIALLALAAFLFLSPSTRQKSPPGALAATKQVALGLALYAGDNDGRLPSSLDALTANYVQDSGLLRDVDLITPGAQLSQLPPKTIMVRHKRDPSITVCADGSSPLVPE
jgi:hypothetical protein